MALVLPTNWMFDFLVVLLSTEEKEENTLDRRLSCAYHVNVYSLGE